MAKLIAPIQVILFFLLAACGALSQSELRVADLLQRDGTTSPEMQPQERRAWRSLPDAPSAVQPPTQAEKFQSFVDPAPSSFMLAAVGINAGVMGEIKPGVTPGLQRSFTASYQAALRQTQSCTFCAPAILTLAPTLGLEHHETNYGANALEYYGRRIPWAGSVILQISRQAKTHPHITRALEAVQPRF